MAITRYAGDRFTVSTSDTKPTGVLDGAYLIDTGNLTQYVRRTVAGTSQWTQLAGGGGGGGTPGGANTQVQFNNAGAFGGDADLTFTDGNRLNVNKLGISGNIYDSNNSLGEGGMVLTNEGQTGVNWKSIESVLSGVGGSGVANYVARWSDEDTITTGVLVDNGTNVGIGTAAPEQLLEISATGDAAIQFQSTKTNLANDDPIGSIIFKNNDTSGSNPHICGKIASIAETIYGRAGLAFSTGRTSEFAERMRIRYDGNVGIGTDAPSRKFEIFGGSARMGVANSTEGVVLGLLSDDAGYLHLNNGSGTNTIQLRGDTVSYFNAGSVGIGTTNPDAKIRVSNSASSGGTFKFTDGSSRTLMDLGGGILSWNAGSVMGAGSWAGTADHQFQTLGTTRDTVLINGPASGTNHALYVTGLKSYFAGNVGIGNILSQAHTNENTSTVKLRVGSDTLTSNQSSAIQIGGYDSSGSGTLGAIEFFNHRDDSIAAKIQVRRDLESSTKLSAGQIDFYTDDGDNNLDVHMSIDALGRVGVGTNSPSSVLHVSGGSATIPTLSTSHPFTISNSANSGMSIISGTDAAGQVVFGDESDADIGRLRYDHSDNSLRLWTNANEKMRINSDGNVGIGTTNPIHKLEVVDAGAVNVVSRSSGGTATLTIDRASVNDDAQLLIKTASVNKWRIATGLGGNDEKLTVYDDIANVNMMSFKTAVGVGVGPNFGTAEPTAPLHVRKIDLVDDSRNALLLLDGKFAAASVNSGDEVGIAFRVENSSGGAQQTTSITSSYQANRNSVNLQPNGGNVGIGTNNPGYPLTVANGITQARVDLTLQYLNDIDSLTNTDLGRVLFRAPYSGTGNNVGSITLRTGASAYRTDLRFKVKATGGSERQGIIIHGTNDGALVGIGQLTNPTFPFQVSASNLENGPAKRIALFFDETDAAAGTGAGIALGGYVGAGTDPGVSAINDFGVIQGIKENSTLGNYASAMRFLTRQNSANPAEQMRINSEGNVGIGTTLPAGRLHASDVADFYVDVDGTDSAVVFKEGGGNSWRIGNRASGDKFNITQSETSLGSDVRFTIDNGGNVGIGTANPAFKLQVQTPAVPTNSTYVVGLDVSRPNSANRGFTVGSNSAADTWTLGAHNADIQLGHTFGTDTGGQPAFYPDVTIKHSDQSVGSVGIGTTAPLGKLHVYGGQVRILDVTSAPSYGARLVVGRDTAQDIEFHVDDLNCKIVADQDADNNANHSFILNREFAGSGANDFRIQKGGGSQLLINTDGNVGINNLSPEHRLHVAGDAIISGYLYDSTNSTGVDGYVLTSKEDGPQWKMIEDVLSGVGGNGTANYIPKWEDEDTIGDSVIAQSGDAIGIGTAAPATKLHVEDSTANTTATKITVQGGSRGFTLGKAHTADNYQHLKPITDTAMALRVMPNGTTAREAYVEVWNKDYENSANFTSWNRGMFYVDTSSNVYLRADGYGTGSVYIGTENNTQTLTIQDSGNVGIGVTSANAKLKVVTSNTDIAIFQGTHATTTNFYISNSNATANNTANLYFAPANKVAGALIQAIAIEDFSTSANRTADLAFQTRKDGTFAEHMRIDSSGNVGIGTNNPTGKFQIGANYTIPGTSYGGDDIYIANTGSHANYDPYVYNTDDFRALITITDGTTTGPTKPGLILYNDDTTAGGFSPMLLFAKRETGTSPYKAATAAIYTRSPLGTGDSNSWIDGELIFATAGAATQGIRQRMVINKEGLIGIGTTAPLGKLDINTEAAEATHVYINGEVNQDKLLYFRHYANSEAAGANAYLGYIGSKGNDNLLSLGHLNTSGTDVPIMHLTEAGQVGIGTTAPDRTLDVRGNALIKNTLAELMLEGNRTSDGVISRVNFYNTAGSDVVATIAADRDGANDAGAITFDTQPAASNNTERMRITSLGSVGIGTNNPQTLLHLKATAPIISLTDSNSFTDADDRFIFRAGSPDGGFFQWYDDSANSTSNLMYIASSGAIQFNTYGSGTHTGTAAYRLMVDSSGNVIEGNLGAGVVDGSGTANTIPRWTDSDTIGDSLITVPSNNRVRVNGNHTSPFIAIGQSAAGISYSQFVNSSTSAVGNGVGLELRALTSAQERQLSFITSRWLDNTDASRKSRLIITTQDGGTGYNTYQAFGKDPILAADAGNIGIGTTNAVYNVHAQTTSASFTHNIKLNKSSNGGDYAEIAFQLWSGAGTGANTFGGSGTSRPSVVLRAINESTSSAAGALVVGTFTGGATNSTLTEKFRINSAGSVGIGTDNPGKKLQISAGDGGHLLLQYSGSTGNSGAVRQIFQRSTGTEASPAGTNDGTIIGTTSYVAYAPSGSSYRNSAAIIVTRHGAANTVSAPAKIALATPGTADDTLVDRLTVLPGGSVGIGTTSPSETLEINHSNHEPVLIKSTGNYNSMITMDSNRSSANSYVGGLAGKWNGTQVASIYLRTGSDTTNKDDGYITLLTASSGTLVERMRIQSDGNVGIGTQSPANKLTITDGAAPYTTANVLLQVKRNAANGNDDTSRAAIMLANNSNGFNIAYGGATDRLRFIDGGLNEVLTLKNGGNVGIGTTSPSNRLHIEYSGATSTQGLFIHNTNNGQDAGIKFSDHENEVQNGIFYYAHADTQSNGTANSFHFNSDQSTLAVILDQTSGNCGYYIGESSPVVAIRGGGASFFNGGNVGIGTETPKEKLHISNGSSAGDGAVYPLRLSAGAQASTAGDATGIKFIQRDQYDDYGAYFRLANTASNPNYLNPRLEFGVQNTNTNVFGSVSTKMVITGGGRVGIGEASPGTILHLKQNDAVGPTISLTNNSKTSYINLWGATGGGTDRTNQFEINAVNTGYGLTLASTDYVRFKTNGIAASDEAMRIAADGNVGIGTTNPGVKLNVVENAANWAAIIKNSNANGYGLSIDCSSNTGTTVFALATYTGAGEGFFVKNNGRAGIGTANPGSLFTISGNSDDGDDACALRIIDEDSDAGSKLPAIMFYGGSTMTGRIRGGDGTFSIAVGSTPTTAFSINTTSRKIAFGGYGSGTHTGTAAYQLSVDSNGNVIETTDGGGNISGSGTANKVAKFTGTNAIGNSQITDNGTSVGINVSPNAANKLEVNGQARATTGMFGNSSVSNVAAKPIHIKYGGTAELRLEDSTSSNYVYDISCDFTNGFRITDVTSSLVPFTIEKTTGHVGIGTTNPSSKLYVNGTTHLQGDTGIGIGPSSSYRLSIEGTNNTPARILSTAASLNLTLGSSTQSNFTNILFNSNSGNAQIWKGGGSYSSYGGASSLNIYCSNGKIAFHPAGNANEVVIQSDGDVDIAENLGVGGAHSGTYVLYVHGDGYMTGNLGLGGTLTEASSLAIKENVETFEPSLDIINKIRPVKYDKKTTGKKEIGLIAEELAELFPELVEKDKNGNPSGVNYSRAVAVLLGGFKELYKEVQELKKRI